MRKILVLAALALLAAAGFAREQKAGVTNSLIGVCAGLDDIARYHSEFGVFTVLFFVSDDDLTPIQFIDDTPGHASALCPPAGSGPLSVLRFEVEPSVAGGIIEDPGGIGEVPVTALRAVAMVPIEGGS